ncbi:MAG: TonB-dependent receptor [Emcibacter sp.]|nr:TonB-dependent receptor [Emcibacter sp.]
MSTSSLRLSKVRHHMVFLAVCGGILFPFVANSDTSDTPKYHLNPGKSVYFSIESQPLRAALIEFSKQSNIQLIFVGKKDTPNNSRSLTGYFTIREALQHLLHKAGYKYYFSKDDTVTIRPLNDKNITASPDTTAGFDLNTDNDPAWKIEEIISLGTRVKGRTAVQTPVPVDTISSHNMRSTGASETGRILQTLAPSFNFSSSSISDGTDAVKPATLRGLGPDQTLVLINGKRRHINALVHVNTSVGRGSTGVDMNAIPASSIKRIEILRDGATAQYGSDAIAGVINIILRDQNDGGEISTSYGQTYAGDGENFIVSASYGIKLPNQGHLTLSAEYRNKDFTNRAGLTGCLQFETAGQDACAEDNIAIDPRESRFNRQNFRVGDSETRQKSLVLNITQPLTDSVDFYMFGTYSNRNNLSAGFYRRANEARWTVIELYPNGFLPLINSKILDYSILAGTRWATDTGWSVDASLSTGGNHFQFLVANSLNASFGADSPTSTDAGTLKNYQIMINLDIAKSYEKSNIAFGIEWRRENYQIMAGDPVSYTDGGQLNHNCPGCDVTPIPYLVGFQIFKGFSPDNAVNESRENLALYTEVEVNLSPDILFNMAVRYEDYSDFGSRINAKLASRYQFSPLFSLRASLSSGFRAPSLQQKYFNSTSTQFVEINGQSVAQERGTFRNDSLVARTLGIPELKNETSINFSLGFIITPVENLVITADYYRIHIKDRIAITGSIPISDDFPLVTATTGATDGQFFTNMADTKTHGVDFIADYDVPLPGSQILKFSLAVNKTKTRINDGSITSPLTGLNDLTLFSMQDRSILEKWQPSSRISFTMEYGAKQWLLVLRNNFYGSYTVCEGDCDTLTGAGQNIQEFNSKTLTDLQLSYNFEQQDILLTIGANNLLNVFPDINKIGQSSAGSIEDIVSSPGVFTYSRRSAPFGYNGGYYYMRLVKKF